MHGSAILRDGVIFTETRCRVLRALATPPKAGEPAPTFADVAVRFGITDLRVEPSLVRDGLLQGGRLTGAGHHAAATAESLRVRERWERVVRWYVRLRTIADSHPPERSAKDALALSDFIAAFLAESLAFRDWMLRASEAPLELFRQADVEALFTAIELKICADIGIDAKHMYVEHPSVRASRAKVATHPVVVDVPATDGRLDLLVFIDGAPRDRLAAR